MTDNEKAATFIGWREGVRCTAERVWGTDACCDGHSAGGKKPHDIPAPDMSDPRNYMKALHELPVWFRWEVTRDDCMVTTDKGQYIEPTPVAALAALYDAEHANQEEVRSA
jgi:hypothetical protein